ncbi:MAG: MBOAT family protein [Nitrosomonadales bacterium]|nr:MBOAT family protein [Nitrosomonadales bacterium]
MLFNSYPFIFLYLPVVLAGFFQLGRINHAYAAAWLALSSLFFYGYWNPAYVGLLLGSIACNYVFGIWIAKAGVRHAAKRKKSLLVSAIAANLLLLGYYKYANFFVGSINGAIGTHWSLGEIMLPLGISFFTFTQIAFLVDTCQGKIKEYNFVHYLLFVTYFPHLIAGPVLHHKEMMPQFMHRGSYRFNTDNFVLGVTIFVLGLSKKVVLADALAEFPGPIFAAVQEGGQPMLFEAWLGALTYSLQLYFDFSGYSDMAIGLSLMFNVRLPLNFHSPYKAANIIEFWRRWHMTLSRFLRDYLYIPLGGNRHGKTRRYLNLMATMLLGGLWHGAGWTFVIWGGLHGIYLVINHAWLAFKRSVGWGGGGWLAQRFAVLLTFLAVVVAWVFFRAPDLATASSMLYGMVGQHGVSLSESLVRHLGAAFPHLGDQVAMNGLAPLSKVNADRALILVILSLWIVWAWPNVQQMLHRHNPVLEQVEPARGWLALDWRFAPVHAWLLAGVFVLSVSFLTRVRDFIYFQF